MVQVPSACRPRNSRLDPGAGRRRGVPRRDRLVVGVVELDDGRGPRADVVAARRAVPERVDVLTRGQVGPPVQDERAAGDGHPLERSGPEVRVVGPPGQRDPGGWVGGFGRTHADERCGEQRRRRAWWTEIVRMRTASRGGRVPRSSPTAGRSVKGRPSDRPDLVVALLVGQLGQPELLQQRRQVHPEPPAVALAQPVPPADGVALVAPPRLDRAGRARPSARRPRRAAPSRPARAATRGRSSIALRWYFSVVVPTWQTRAGGSAASSRYIV